MTSLLHKKTGMSSYYRQFRTLPARAIVNSKVGVQDMHHNQQSFNLWPFITNSVAKR